MFDKEKAQERLSKLSGGVAVFKVHFGLHSHIIQRLLHMQASSLCFPFSSPHFPLTGWRS